MHLGLRLLFAFLAITGLAAFFVLRVFVTEIKPSVREVVEDLMVDTANLLAEVAAPEFKGLPEQQGALARAVQDYSQRTVDVKIWGLRKTTLDLRVTATNAQGLVVFDSGMPSAVGEDYSRWRDVLLTLRGDYGARTSRVGGASVAGDRSVMHVAAPIRDGERLLGVLVIAKPMSTIAPFIERAERKVLWAGVLLLGLSMAIGVAVTLWTVHSVRRLKAYADRVGSLGGLDRTDSGTGVAAAALGSPREPRPVPPDLPGELGDLAQAMDRMRVRLEGSQRVEHQVRALTHELKSPLSAIRGAAELLHEPLPAADRQRFAAQIVQQGNRLQSLVEHLLELSKLESLDAPPNPRRVSLRALVEAVLTEHAPALAQAGFRWRWLGPEDAAVHVDEALLSLAVSNLVVNALLHGRDPSSAETRTDSIDELHDSPGRWLDLSIETQQTTDGLRAALSLRDHGPGVADFALPQLGKRFYTAPQPGAPLQRRGSGLGLAIVQHILWLHQGGVVFSDARPGLRVTLLLPVVGR